MYDILQLNEMLVPELKDVAEKLDLKNYKRLNKQELVYKILDEQAFALVVAFQYDDPGHAGQAESGENSKDEKAHGVSTLRRTMLRFPRRFSKEWVLFTADLDPGCTSSTFNT